MPDGTCLDFLAPAPGASFMGTPKTTRFGDGGDIVSGLILFAFPGRLLGRGWRRLKRLDGDNFLIRIQLKRGLESIDLSMGRDVGHRKNAITKPPGALISSLALSAEYLREDRVLLVCKSLKLSANGPRCRELLILVIIPYTCHEATRVYSWPHGVTASSRTEHGRRESRQCLRVHFGIGSCHSVHGVVPRP